MHAQFILKNKCLSLGAGINENASITNKRAKIKTIYINKSLLIIVTV